MNPQIHTALAELQDALTEINDINQALKIAEGTATDAASQAGKALGKANALFEKVQSQHKENLEQLNQGYEKLGAQHTENLEGIRKSYDQLESSLLAKGDLLQQAAIEKTEAFVGKLDGATEEQKQAIADALIPYQELAEASKTLTDYLKSVNFPARLDKIDSSVMTINQGVQNLSDKLDRQKDQLIQSLAEMQQSQETKMGVLKKQQNLYFGLSLAVMLVITALVIFL